MIRQGFIQWFDYLKRVECVREHDRNNKISVQEYLRMLEERKRLLNW